MSYSPINAYLSNLDTLVFDSPSETIHTDKDINEELDLWSKAQFTFDVKPGNGIFDEEKSKASTPVSPAASEFDMQGLDSATYESLVNYLDYELPSRPEVKLEKQEQPKQQRLAKIQPRIQPRPLAPAPSPIVAAPTRQVLMPKPPTPTQILSTLAQNNSSNGTVVAAAIENKSTTGMKRALVNDETDDSVTPDEDKRRRNTAASARFRVKKKMREQAMEQSVREMTVKSDKLQDRVNQLEIEIKFLRSLLLDKASKN